MRRSTLGALATAALVASLVAAVPAQGDPVDRRLPRGNSGLDVYVGTATPRQFDAFVELGLDREDVLTGKQRRGGVALEAILTAAQAKQLRSEGIRLRLKKIDGRPASRVLTAQQQNGHEVYRSYSEPGGLRDEMVAVTRRYRALTELEPLGPTVQGREIFAVKVTRNARTTADGSRPAVLYTAAQHAREWITPEMVRRLMHFVLRKYGESPRITRLLDTTELWFVPVANPDGYDFTFTEGNRLWRKNLRDNDGDGEITSYDGVDPNRNYPYKWGWDNEGSSDDPLSETYRGTEPVSEPETRAILRLANRVGFEYHINYHSAAELLLYGTGWQVSTPTPDDVVFETLAGTDDNSAVPGYDPDIGAELYTTNGETTETMHEDYGTLAFTPEMTTCQTASASDPNDEWEPQDCASGFNFPDDEQLIEEEFRKNIPFALSVAASTHDPDDPKSSVGLETPPFVTDPFDVSYGGDQPVAVIGKRSVDNMQLTYRINGGDRVRAPVSEWQGGERYGETNDDYYAEFRGTVTGAEAGDSVEVWFTGNDPEEGGHVASDHFTYEVASDTGGDVLVLASEDVTGASPTQTSTSAQYDDDYARSIRQAGYTVDTYDVDEWNRTAPHHLGVLSHYDAVVWETGDDIIPRGSTQPPGTAAELALDLELTVRDYLNEGGKLLLAGKYALFAEGADGLYWYNPFEEQQEECTTPEDYPCLPLLNDFMQYWLGAYLYVSGSGQDENGDPYPVEGTEGEFDGFLGQLNGGTSADNQDHTAAFLLTSSFLPVEEFPQFASAAPLEWQRPGGAPFEPFTGDWYVYSQQADESYKRLTRTIDMTGASTGSLEFRTSFDTETDWDYVFVEARPAGTDDWTTLPDENMNTGQDTGDSCEEGGWAEEVHPQLQHYMNEECEPTGTTGEWHAATGSSGGWQDWSVDLSDYADERVQVHITYASDQFVQGLGSFVDDARVVVDGTEVAATSFETDLGGWRVTGPPPGSPDNANNWIRSQTVFEDGAGVTTDDTVYVGFGVEGLRTQAMRNDFVLRSLTHLLG